MPSDASVFDRDNRLFPRARDPDAAQVMHDYYIVFPHLQPFADPTRLSPAETSDSLYRTPLFRLLSEGPPARFALRLHYDATGGGDRSTLDLNALQLRRRERAVVRRREKAGPRLDYSISYDLGQVTFLNPDALFGQGSAQVTARFEEQGLFAVAPTNILGLSTPLLARRSRRHQPHRHVPEGAERLYPPRARLRGRRPTWSAGSTLSCTSSPRGITSFLNKLISKPSTAPSLLDLNAELAFTKPDPNQSGEAFLEEFEAEAGVDVSLRETSWEFGSRPQQANGLEDIGFGGGFDPADAVALTWQNLVPAPRHANRQSCILRTSIR